MGEPDGVSVNARVLKVPSNGQKRVAEEILARLPDAEVIAPPAAWASGVRGHAWEQLLLPLQTSGKRLWSPSTSGPVFHPNHIVTVHDIAFVDGPEWFSKSFAALYDQIVRRLVRSSRHLITVSEFTRGRLIEYYRAAPEHVTTIHSGVAGSFQIKSPEEVLGLRDRLALSRPYLVAFLGSDPRKNTARVIQAWAAAAKRLPEARLVTFGRSSNSSVFASAQVDADQAGIVHAGPLSDQDLACLYSGAAGLVFPSLYEGFGLPVIEAAACGCPVITSNVSALPEVSPADAVLVDPLSVDEIAGAMVDMLDRSDSEAARTARAKSTGRFSWDRAASHYTDVFKTKFR